MTWFELTVFIICDATAFIICCAIRYHLQHFKYVKKPIEKCFFLLSCRLQRFSNYANGTTSRKASHLILFQAFTHPLWHVQLSYLSQPSLDVVIFLENRAMILSASSTVSIFALNFCSYSSGKQKLVINIPIPACLWSQSVGAVLFVNNITQRRLLSELFQRLTNYCEELDSFIPWRYEVFWENLDHLFITCIFWEISRYFLNT